jgi:hypothetical protein
LIEGTNPQKIAYRCGGIDKGANGCARLAEVAAAAFAAKVSPGNRTATNHRVECSHASISPEKSGSVGCDHATC